jgi:hypothetical protein
MPAIPQTLGSPVSTRTINWEDQVIKAWGSEYRTPDHNIYKFSNGVGKDSTDKGKTGIYGVEGDTLLILDGVQYPDMRDGIIADIGTRHGAARNGYGNYPETDADPQK